MDGSVRIWSLKTGQNLHVLTGHSSLVGLLSLSPTTLVSAAADSTLRIWNPETGASQHVLQAHQGAITCFQHDEFKVLSGSDGALKMWDARDGTVVRDLLTNILGVWQVVFDERFCVAASNSQDHTFLDVWDFGDEGEADVEAARIVEDEDESDVEDDHSGYGRGSGPYGTASMSGHSSSAPSAQPYGASSGMVINEDEEDEEDEDVRYTHDDEEDEDSMMADATSASGTTRHTHTDVTPTASDHDPTTDGPASPQYEAAGPSSFHKAGVSGGSWSLWPSSSSSPTPFAPHSSTIGSSAFSSTSGAPVSQTFSPSAEGFQYFGSGAHPDGPSSPPAPSAAAGLAATRRLSRAIAASASDAKGKGRAFPTTSDIASGPGLASGSGSSSSGAGFGLGLGLGLGLNGVGSPTHASSESTPPTSSIGGAGPPSMHGPWGPSTYTIQGAQKESEESPSKGRVRRHGR